MNEQYTDDLSTIDVFPNGKMFRLVFDANVGKFRILAKSH